jgi:hypothetical protein
MIESRGGPLVSWTAACAKSSPAGPASDLNKTPKELLPAGLPVASHPWADLSWVSRLAFSEPTPALVEDRKVSPEGPGY